MPISLDAPICDPIVQRMQKTLSKTGPCHPLAERSFAITGYAQAIEVLRSSHFSPDANADAEESVWNRLGSRFFIFASGADHSRMRRLVLPFFSARSLSSEYGRVRRITQDTMYGPTELAEDGIDAVQAWAAAISAHVLAIPLGLDRDEIEQLQGWASRLPGTRNSLGQTEQVFDQLAAEIEDFSERLVRTARGREGLVGFLQEAVANQTVTTDEAVAALALLVIAGYETSTNASSEIIRFLLNSVEALHHLARNPEEIDSAVEELIRLYPPAHAVARTATQDTQIGSVAVPRGSRVMVILSLCNRDPLTFKYPERYQPDRSGPSHLSFAAGPHYCVGAPLARHQLAALVQELVEVRDAIHLNREAKVNWYPRMLGRGVGTLFVRRSNGA